MKIILVLGFMSISLFPMAQSEWALMPFVKQDAVNPVLGPTAVSWEEKDVFNPAVVVRDDSVILLYRAQDRIGTSRIGLAYSLDGLHFMRGAEPVLFPSNDSLRVFEWPGGCEDPRVVEDDRGVYYMTYTGFDGHLARLMVASSTDLRHWTKHGPVFADTGFWSKSGSIVSRYVGGRIIATRVNGKYWMYWGDTNIWAATSDDLVHWTVVPEPVLRPRRGMFDSDLVEPGPPAMLTDKGILLIYNGRNVRSKGDSLLPEGTYAGGQALMDRSDPTRVIRRLDRNFIHPDKPYEITGQVGQVCFLEALARFKGKWFLYYGTADSKIAVATGR